MKKMRRLITSLTAFIIFLSCFNSSAITAAENTRILAGDVNNDGRITATDALLALQFSVGKVTLSETASIAARVQKNDSCTATDALLILQVSVGKISATELPSGEYIIIAPDVPDKPDPDVPDKPDPDVPDKPDPDVPDKPDPDVPDKPDPDVPDKPVPEKKPSEFFSPLSAEEYWSYKTLTAVQKQLYSEIAAAVKSVEYGYIELGSTNEIDFSDVRAAYFAVQKDRPDLFYMPHGYLVNSSNGKISINLTEGGAPGYIYTKAQIEELTPLIDKRINEIIDSVTTVDMSENEIALALHDWICSNASYHYEAVNDPEAYPEAWSAASVLVGDGLAVCEGLSRAYQYLLYRCGINSTLISGIAAGGGHMWNISLISGQWYESDITWDLASANGISHLFYNQTTAVMEGSHTRSDDINTSGGTSASGSFNYSIPTANSVVFNYFREKNLHFEGAEDISERFPKIAADIITSENGYIEITVEGTFFRSFDDIDALLTSDILQKTANLLYKKGITVTSVSKTLKNGAPGFGIKFS